MNFKDFKAVSGNDNYTVLQHPKGHKVTVMHNALSPSMRNEIKKIGLKKEPKEAKPELCEGGKIPHYAEGTPVPVPEQDPTDIQVSQALSGQMPQIPTNAPDINQPTDPGPAQQPQAPQQPQDTDPNGANAYGNAVQSGIAEQKAGIQGAADAQAQQGQQEAAALTSGSKAQQDIISKYQSTMDGLVKHNAELEQDVKNGFVDPNHYWDNLGTGKRIAASIGLALGGFSQGMGGGPNPALQMISNHIANDIEAQKTNLSSKQGLLAHNLQLMGNITDASKLTQIQQQGLVSNQLKLAAANAATPMAKAGALQAAGQLDHSSAAELSQIAIRKTLSGAMQNSQSTSTPQSAINQNIQKVRMAEMTGLVDKSGADDAKKVLEAGSNVQDTVDEMKKFMQGGTALPLTARRGEAQALMAKAISQVNHLAGLTRLSGEDIAVINKQLPDLTSLVSGVTGQNAAKLDEFQKTVNSQLNAHMKTILPGYTPIQNGGNMPQSSGFKSKSFKSK